MAASCPSNAGSSGLLSRWRAVTKALSGRDRTGIVRRKGPVIEISKAALMQCEEKVWRQKSQGTSAELEKQSLTANSPCASRQSCRTRRREKQKIARGRIRERRLVEDILARQLNPQLDGNASRMNPTFNALHSWRHGGRACIKNEEELNPKEKSYVSGDDTRFTGVVVDAKNGKKQEKIPRVEEDGILLVVPARINGKLFSALIDSGATRCFITQQCCTVAGLSCIPQDTFLELGHGARALSRGLVQGAPLTLAGVTTKTDLTVSRLLHNVDIVLGINWLKSINPIIDWCSGKVYMPNAIHTALLEGNWLGSEHTICTVRVLSDSTGLKCVQDDQMKNSLAILRTPQFWTAINSRTNFAKGKARDDCTVDCQAGANFSRKLFIQSHPSFGFLYVKKLRNNATVPKRGSEDAAGYDIASAEDTVVPAKGKAVIKTGISIAIPEGCYGRIAPRSGLTVKKFIDVGAGVIDADYRGEIGVVLFNHSEEDFEVKPGDRIAQLILEKIATPQVKETADLSCTERGSNSFGSTGIGTSEEKSSRISILQRVKGMPKIKNTNTQRVQREFVSVKKMQKLMKQKEPIFLCIIKADQSAPGGRRRTRGKRKTAVLSSSAAQDSHGVTEKTKRELSKVTGPKKDFKTVEERAEEMIAGVAEEHQTKLRSVIAEFRDVFRDKLPKGPPPNREVAHSIEVQPGSEPTYRTPYRLRPSEQDELEEQVRDLLAQGFIRPSQSPYGAPVLFVPKKDAMAYVYRLSCT